ncbi:MAG: ABC transporter permease [Spirochaetes bacterium]|nr:ABC transporter permease [Spirochaetota bacterium]
MMKIAAFLRKDLLIALSYRFNLLLQLVKIAVTLLMFYFIGQTFSGAISPYLARYGGDYFSYVLVGYAVSSFISVGLNALSDDVRSAQVEGTLEALLGTPTSIYTILIGNSLWSFIQAFLESFLLIAFGAAFLGFHLSIASIAGTLLILSLTLVAFLSIGMLSASFIMIFKQGNPIKLLFGTSSYFLGGIIFPVEVLPLPLQYLAEALPATHAIKALRELLLARTGFADIVPVLFNLLIFIAIVMPVSILAFRFAVRRAKRDGSLVQY